MDKASRTDEAAVKPAGASGTPKKARRGIIRLSDLLAGETGRVVRVDLVDAGCRRRFAELGLAEGMKVTVTGTGDTLMVALGNGRMGVGARCAEQVWVVKVA
jgi:Fe2+ transport system protein FeoA